MITLRATIAAIAVLAAGCVPVGKDFVRPTPATVELRAATPEQVRARYGEPRSERSWTRGDLELAKEVGTPFGAPRVPGTMTELYYYYENRGEAGVAPGVEPSRSARYWFWNGRLVGFQSSSSFKADSTVFDDRKVEAIRPWESLRAELVAALGEPSGMRVFPLAPNEDQQVLTWFAFEYDTGARQQRVRTLHVLVNGIGVVVDLRFDRSAKPIAPPPVPAYTPIPIYTPPVKKK
jgi:hypothetical protein